LQQKSHPSSLNTPKIICSHPKYLIYGLLGLALLIRLFYLYEIKDNPFFNIPQIDALFHDDWAKQILAGDWSSSIHGAFYKSPLYPYFMAVVYKIFGHSYLNLRLVQMVMGVASCFFIYLLGQSYFSRRVGYFAFFFAAVYGTFIFFDAEMEIVCLHIFLNLLLLVFLTKAHREGKICWYLLSGFLLGLSALSVPTILLFFPLVLLWLYLCRRKGELKSLRPALFFALTTLLTIVPVTLHNYLHGHGFILISANGGLNFYLGNNLHADKTTSLRPGITWDHFTSQPRVAAGYTVSKIEENNFWTRKSLQFILNHPGKFIQLLLKKFSLFWQSYEIKRNRDIYFFKRYSRLLQAPLAGFGLIAPLGLLGIGLCWSERRAFYLLLFYLIAVMAGVVLFFVTARYRLPAVPILILFAAYAIDWFLTKVRKRDFRFVSFACIPLIFLGGIINYDFWDLEKNNNFARSHHNRGHVYYVEENYQKAVDEWNIALQLYAPGDFTVVDTHFYLATAYNYKLSDYQKAIEHCQQGLKILPDIPELQTELGWAYYQQGQKDKGIQAIEEAIENDSLYKKAYEKLARIYTWEGNRKKAIQNYQRVAQLNQGDDKRNILNQLANLYFQQGLEEAKKENWSQAGNSFKKALDNNPLSAEIHYNLGLTYLYAQRWKPAVKHLQRAVQLKPDKGEAFGAMGSAYLGMGQKEKAAQMFRRALEIKPSLEMARQQLKILGQ
jgi:tetratricopeptide (TPR) repeat protein